jgi:hypothetical protein
MEWSNEPPSAKLTAGMRITMARMSLRAFMVNSLGFASGFFLANCRFLAAISSRSNGVGASTGRV